MNLLKVSVTIAALVTAGTTLSAPNPARVAVSASSPHARGQLELTLARLCTERGGYLTTFTQENSYATYACARVSNLTGGAPGTYNSAPDADFYSFASGSFAVLKMHWSDSLDAVKILNGVCFPHLEPGIGSHPGQVSTCPNLSPGVLIGGISDVGPEAFLPETVGQLFTGVHDGPTDAGQTFGVAVSGPLYAAMFNAQRNSVSGGAATVDFPIPNYCGLNDTARLECVPTISKGQFNAIADSNGFGTAKLLGAPFLAPQLPAGSQLRYVRLPDGSGTQVAAQNYFLGLPCSTAARAAVPQPSLTASPELLPSDDFGALRVLGAWSENSVRTELGRSVNPAGGTTYAIGVLSGTNTQPQDWRWLRVQGVAMAENAIPNLNFSNISTAKNGQYDFFYQFRYFFKTSAASYFWQNVGGQIGYGPIFPGILGRPELYYGYTRLSDCAAVSKDLY